MFEKKLTEELVQMNQYLQTENLPEILMKVVSRLMEAERAIVIVSDGAKLSDGQRDLGIQYSSHPPEQMSISRSVIEEAMESKRHFALRNEAVNPSKSMGAYKIRSCIAAAVYHGGQMIGALYCDNRKSKRGFTIEDADGLKTIADVVAPIVFSLKVRELEYRAGNVISIGHSPAAKLDDLVGISPSIQELRKNITQVAGLNHSVLITGPSGCGKEVVARLLHSESGRTGKFVAMNCAESTESMLAMELFGHEKGAFTDATVSRTGLIVAADDGTLFLDEIGNASMDFQAKLLRVIETKEVRPIGSNVAVGKVNVRFIFATNRDLEQMVAEKTFMQDLYYRITQIRLRVLPLSKRKEDIASLAAHYSRPKTVSSEALRYLTELDWPGNVRELKHLVELARDLSGDKEIMMEEVLTASKYSSKLDKVHEAIRAVETGEMNFFQLKAGLEEGLYTSQDLESILIHLYRNEGENWAAVGRKLGMTSREELKKFDNFIQNTKKRHINL